MNCCDYNCTQGRNCPARVAKIKSRDHAKAALPHSPWRVYLRHLAKWMLICIAAVLVAGLVLAIAPRSSGRVIDCSLAEISPDFTPAMREACRKARHA